MKSLAPLWWPSPPALIMPPAPLWRPSPPVVNEVSGSLVEVVTAGPHHASGQPSPCLRLPCGGRRRLSSAAFIKSLASLVDANHIEVVVVVMEKKKKAAVRVFPNSTYVISVEGVLGADYMVVKLSKRVSQANTIKETGIYSW